MFNSRFTNIAVTTSPVQVLKKSALRYRVVFFNSTNNQLFLFADSTVASTNGFPLLGNGGPLDLCVVEHGSVVQDECWAIMGTSTAMLGVLEVMACGCELEDLLRDYFGHVGGDKEYHRGRRREMPPNPTEPLPRRPYPPNPLMPYRR